VCVVSRIIFCLFRGLTYSPYLTWKQSDICFSWLKKFLVGLWWAHSDFYDLLSILRRACWVYCEVNSEHVVWFKNRFSSMHVLVVPVPRHITSRYGSKYICQMFVCSTGFIFPEYVSSQVIVSRLLSGAVFLTLEQFFCLIHVSVRDLGTNNLPCSSSPL